VIAVSILVPKRGSARLFDGSDKNGVKTAATPPDSSTKIAALAELNLEAMKTISLHFFLAS
jgi:hypothetical protein